MADIRLPSIELLRQLMRYDEETGTLYWLHRPVDFFRSYASYRRWNTRFSGKPALNAIGKRGHRHGCMLGFSLIAHRVIWAMVHEKWPEVIDHINGDPSDNRLGNMRAVSQRENMKNAKMSAVNTSGVTGVSWSGSKKKWLAMIAVDGKQTGLGHFQNKQDAIAARQVAEIANGYHPNHGKPRNDRKALSWG